MAHGIPELVPVLSNHRFDEDALARYLEDNLNGFAGPCAVRQFQGGQSNPTFHLSTPSADYVLRKKPGGILLPSAHAIDREYRIMAALSGSRVPVPTMRHLCTDASVIGTIFYVMDYMPGRVFADRSAPGISSDDRRAIFCDLAIVLAELHKLDPAKIGLGDFGRMGNYIPRQIARWSSQYQAAALPPVDDMDQLLDWLNARAPAIADEATIAHGDYRLGNVMIDRTAPKIIGVLDWELATLGHPLADLAYCCLPWRTPPELHGIAGLTIEGMPSEAEFVADYCAAAGRADVPDFEFFIVFSLYRWAAIVAGVYRRALDGNAADARALEAGDRFRRLAKAAMTIARGG